MAKFEKHFIFSSKTAPDIRTAEGKDHLLILDHAGNHLRLGMVTDVGQDYLDNGRERRNGGKRARERGEPLPKLCQDCRAVLPSAARVCLSCGRRYMPVRMSRASTANL